MTTGSAQGVINTKSVAELSMPFAPIAEQELGWILDLTQSFPAHLEETHFLGRSEAIFPDAEDAESVGAISLQLENAIDQVFEEPRSGDAAVLGDMTDEQEGELLTAGEGE